MISDVLAEAIATMDEYLTDPVFAGVYEGDLRERILRCRSLMADIQGALDLEQGICP
jgi:hypothetical protein